MIRKYASFESAQILDVKGTQNRAHHASLEKYAEFEDYRTEDGYLYARIRAISSRVNKNHDGWPSVELAGGDDIFSRHQASEGGFTITASEGNPKFGFATFLGKPVFVDHNNSNPDRARGVIVDAKLHVEDHRTAAHDPYYASDEVDSEHLPPTWVELLLEVDANNFPKLAKAIVDGSKDSKKGIDGFSMGCDVEKSVCNICKNAAVSPDEFCNHVKLKGAHFDYIDKKGRKTSKRSYENCYGVKFFEISAVFDPADETALIREVRAGINKEAADLQKGQRPVTCPDCQGLGEANGAVCNMCGGKGFAPSELNWEGTTNVPHQMLNPQGPGVLSPMHEEFQKHNIQPMYGKQARTAEAPLPQSDMMTTPEYVDTMREEEVCPVCGSDMDEGHQCDVCGFVAPPDGLNNPDLDKAEGVNQVQDPLDLGQTPDPVNLGQENMSSPVGNPEPNNMTQFASVSDEMAWQIYHPKLAGRINSIERPIRPDGQVGTNEPQETVVSDQTKPVTTRTAASMIAAANKEKTMSNARTAADAPTADTSADKRVDATGVGGVMDGSNESASAADRQVDVEGKGGVLQDSNSEASKAEHTENLPTADPKGDDSGFNKKKNIPDQHTKTFDNSNEPESAVTNKAFPTAHQKQAWGDERAYPTEGGIDQGPASKGTQPADPVGKAGDRIDLTQPVTVNNPQKGTDQWTGTDGNGVTRQQDPVTRVVDPNIDVKKVTSVVELFKIADAEVELGLIEPSEKYDRIAELEEASAEEIQATAKVLAKVKTAGLRKNASTRQGGVGRVPSFRSREASVSNGDGADDQLFM